MKFLLGVAGWGATDIHGNSNVYAVSGAFGESLVKVFIWKGIENGVLPLKSPFWLGLVSEIGYFV
ncbi:MAG: hypothetical protein ABIS50_02970 [Luteolibacter sp.]|uniref:hypothetical protein n=1 Tax=Luteolibacter sp. TaxID=1962973 RepID=UPI0032642003